MLTPGEIADLKSQIRSEQLAAWRTSNVRRSKPSAEQEARNGMMVIEETCWEAVPEHYRRIDRALDRLGQPPLPYDATIVRVSTWMGGDRDGNPNVTAKVTLQVNLLMRARAAELYYREVEKLLFELSHTGPISDEMQAEVEKYTGDGSLEDGVRRKVFTQVRSPSSSCCLLDHALLHPRCFTALLHRLASPRCLPYAGHASALVFSDWLPRRRAVPRIADGHSPAAVQDARAHGAALPRRDARDDRA